MRSTTFRWVCGLLLIGLLWIGLPASYARPTTSSPWLVYTVFPDSDAPGKGGLWIVHPDGSDRRQIARGKGILSLAASPDGRYVAYYAFDPDPVLGDTNITLDLLTMANGTARTITPLTTPATAMKSPGDFGPVRAFEQTEPPLQWSPDGQTLAFIGAQGPSRSADLFIYSVKTNKVTGLSSGSSQAVEPSWSPDGKYILHFGVEGFGSGAGDEYAGVWVARADGSGITTLYKPTGGGEGSLGWIDSTAFLAWSWSIDCGKHLIRAYNVETKREVAWVTDYYQATAYAPSAGVLLFSISEYQDSCQNVLAHGLYRVAKNAPTPVKIADAAPTFMDWSPEAGVFFGLVPPNGHDLIRITPDGELSDPIKDFKTIPLVSPDGQLWAWIDSATHTLNAADAETRKPVTIAENVLQVVWSH